MPTKKPSGGKKPTGIRTRGAPTKALALRKPGRKRRQDRELTPAQHLFIQRYIVRFNATTAYAESHPNAKPSTCATEGSLLLKDPRVAKEIKAWLAESRKRNAHSADRVLEAMAALAFTSISDVYDKDGILIPPNQLPRDIASAVKKVKRTEIMEDVVVEGSAKQRVLVGHTVEVEMADKIQPLKALGTHYNLFTERVEVVAGEEMLKLIREARERSLRAPG